MTNHTYRLGPFNGEQVQYIANVLGERPYHEVAPIIAIIQQSVQETVTQAAAEAAAQEQAALDAKVQAAVDKIAEEKAQKATTQVPPPPIPKTTQCVPGSDQDQLLDSVGR